MTKNLTKSLYIPAILFLLTGTSLPLLTAPAWAQTADDPVASAAAPKKVAAVNANNLALGLVVQKISRSSGMPVVTESTLTTRPFTFASSSGSLDYVLGNLVGVLPKGVVLRATLVPESEVPVADVSAAVDGDAVANLLRAQDAFAPKSAKTADPAEADKAPTFVPGKFELFGRKVTLAEAAPQIAALHLRPVYIVMSSRPAIDPVSRMNAMQNEAMKQFLSMTPDQRRLAMESQFSALMNMDPGDRMAMLGQMMDQGKYMQQMMQNMPPDQRNEFNSEIMQAMQQSGLIPKAPQGGTGAPAPKP